MTKEQREQAELEEDIYSWALQYAQEHEWTLNYEEKQLRAVIRGLARNLIRHGEQYCPCRIRSGDSEEDKEIICPCIFHENEIRQLGRCHCNLFFDDKFFEELLKKKVPPPEQPLVETDPQ